MILSPLWLPITLAAALFQTWRTAMQQKLRGQLSVNAAAVVRYLYGVPVGALLLALYAALFGGTVPSLGWAFFALCAAGGLGQILGTNLLIMSFSHRGFAVGTAYAKTEAVQGAILALLLLGEHISALAWCGIAVGVAGVLWLTLAGKAQPGRDLARAALQPAAMCGLAAGFFFAGTSVLVKAANQEVPAPDPIFRALVTLVFTNILQTIMQGGWLLAREPQQARAVLATWRSSAQVGALSACGSACWFSAFALAPVALVRAVGQVEILMTLLFSHFYLRERPSRAEILGALTVVCGVVLVLLGR
ncbi:DMT family transporter [Siccirubricoccus sp. KC 17139]|uniref:DMT family transporter n=1 Tax=Siccirubricoccus soli TaxID=2899147 RepID=A0ABT1DDH7_9PROT|nr:DMT family transporter [Siccirubricoccus soli]MCO6419978.1 DMT family transporter [Siccirubricoccus soli]MCP2686113.1 DMT family transporter [Siccirubricoccus soli]